MRLCFLKIAVAIAATISSLHADTPKWGDMQNQAEHRFKALHTPSGTFKWCISYEQAGKRAQSEDKIVLVMLSKDGCDTCERLRVAMLQNKELAAEIENRFVAVHINADKEPVPKGIDANTAPVVYFEDQYGRIMDSYQPSIHDLEGFLKKLRELKLPTYRWN